MPSVKTAEAKKPKMAKSSKKKEFIALEKNPSLEEGETETSSIKTTPYSSTRAVVYMSHLPHGMYEKQLREYLGQFGSITNLRLGRSRKTGVSKGYAFVEFKYPEVAQIVVETMNNYLMFEKLVKAEVVPQDKLSKNIFKGKINPENPPLKKARYLSKKLVNSERTLEQNNKRLKKQLKKLEKVKGKLMSVGLNVQMEFQGIREGLPASGKTPVMEVDEDDLDITMKTPPNIKKVMSRNNSALNSAIGSPASKSGTPKMSKKKEMQPRDLVMQAVADKLKGSGADPKNSKKSVSTATSEASTPHQSGKKRKREHEDSPMPISAKKMNQGKSPLKAMNNTPKQNKNQGSVALSHTPKSTKKTNQEKVSPKIMGTPKSQKKKKQGPIVSNDTPKSVKKVSPGKSSIANLDTPKSQKKKKNHISAANTPNTEKNTKGIFTDGVKSGKKTMPVTTATETPKSVKKNKKPMEQTPKSSKKAKSVITESGASPKSTPQLSTPRKKPKTPKSAKKQWFFKLIV